MSIIYGTKFGTNPMGQRMCYNIACTAAGYEYEDVDVAFRGSPEGLDIQSVYYEDQGCIMHLMTPEEEEALEVDILEHMAKEGLS